MSQTDTKSRPTCMTLSSLGVNIESTTTTAHPSEEGMTKAVRAIERHVRATVTPLQYSILYT